MDAADVDAEDEREVEHGTDEPASLVRALEATAVRTTNVADDDADDGTIPRDAVTIEAILRDMGVRDCEKRVIAQGMEFAHRATSEVLVEAAAARSHALGRPASARDVLTVDDVKVGVKAVLMRSFIDPPSAAMSRGLASRVNAKPLPKVSNRPGIHVPTEMNLLADNWDIGPPHERDVKRALELEREAEAMAAASAAAAAARAAIAASEPTNVADGARADVAFEVKTAKATDVEEREDLGDFAEFMDVDDDDE
ncbi:Histone-fold [Ostreococcus tauri]|uniref:Histone-fold n=1 Tax=Ostreococcus tauri TaxID=70448 RepID=A0A096P948_OSTTA|nr:Histone-fold [Ostreococcus tauri]CEG00481.1 Histone-fold [Ostreococcus tauri]|eukprot:XP_003083770.2 Histone-fold [Ostreococcus tauri]